jgi:BlaI family transcriptional regulator, penicillinase repressor
MARPRTPGLTENEMEVMKVLWQTGPIKVGELLEQLPRSPKPAYTSLITLLQMMEKKGHVKHVREGKAFVYYPILQKKEFLKAEFVRMARHFFDGSAGSLVMNLVDEHRLTPEEIQELRDRLEAK